MLRMVLACEKHDPFRMLPPKYWIDHGWWAITYWKHTWWICSFAAEEVQGSWEGCRFKHSAIQHPEISFWTIDVVTCWWVQKKRSLLTYCNQYRSWLFPQLLATLPKTLQITQDFQVQVPKNEGTEPYSRLFWGWVFPLKISLTSIQPI